MNNIILGSFIILFGCGTVALAEETQRYTLERSDNGYVRMDMATGATSMCSQSGNQLICRMAADDLQAYEGDIAALEAKIDSLEKRLSVLEGAGSSGLKPNLAIETEKDFQTSLDRMDHFFRRFMGIVKEFQQFGSGTSPIPDPT